jgi:hypothetical protein
VRKKTQSQAPSTHLPHIRGHLSSPLLRPDGKVSAAWEDLRKGQQVEIYHEAVHLGSGEVDTKTDDSRIVWVLHAGGHPRRLYSLDDGYSFVIQDPDPSLNQQQNRAIARGWN